MKLIPLTRGRQAIVDDKDHLELSKFKWNFSADGYAVRLVWQKGQNRSVSVRMHRQICSAPAGIDVDHIDGNTLNNTRANLRLASRAENIRNQKRRKDNTSGYKGVYLHKPSGKYIAQIVVNRKAIYLGYFETAEQGHAAYCAAARKHHGEFARFA